MRKHKKFRWLAGILVACMLFGGMTAFARDVEPQAFSFGFEGRKTLYSDVYHKVMDTSVVYLLVNQASGQWQNVSLYVMHCNRNTLRPDSIVTPQRSYGVGTHYITIDEPHDISGGFYRLAGSAPDATIAAIVGYWKP